MTPTLIKYAPPTYGAVAKSIAAQLKKYAPGGTINHTLTTHIPQLSLITDAATQISVREYLEQLLTEALGLMGLLSLNEAKSRGTIRALFPLFYERAQQYGWRAMDVALFLKKCQMNAYPYLGEAVLFKSALFFKAMAQYHTDTSEYNNLQQNKQMSRRLLNAEAQQQAAQDYHNPSPKVLEMRKKIKEYKDKLAKKMKATGVSDALKKRNAKHTAEGN